MKKKTESPMYKYIISQITFKYVYGNIMRCQFHLSSAATTGAPQKKYFQKIIFVIIFYILRFYVLITLRECKQLENRQELRGNVSLLVTQGQAHYWAGDDEQVCLLFLSL